MTLPASGSISLNEVNVELGNSGTAQIGLGDASVRGLFEVASGQITMAQGHGKANEWAFTISSNVADADLSTLATAAGWNGSTKLLCNIAAGVYLYGNTAAGTASTKPPGLLIAGTFPNGVIINNSGYIMGKGGSGDRVANTKEGGPALKITTGDPVTINNLSGAYIAGGGGGSDNSYNNGGGGAGGGDGGGGNGAGGLPGNYGQPGSGYGGGSNGGRQGGGGGGISGTSWPSKIGSGGGGGRILSPISTQPAGPLGGYGGSGGSAGGNATGKSPVGPNSFAPGAGGGGGFGAYGGGTGAPFNGTGRGWVGGAAISGSYTQGTWAGTIWGTS